MGLFEHAGSIVSSCPQLYQFASIFHIREPPPTFTPLHGSEPHGVIAAPLCIDHTLVTEPPSPVQYFGNLNARGIGRQEEWFNRGE